MASQGSVGGVPAAAQQEAPVLLFTVNPNRLQWRSLLQQAGVPAAFPEDVADMMTQIKFAIMWQPPPGLLQQCTQLQVVASLGAGIDHLMGKGQVPDDVTILRIVDPLMAQRMATYVFWGVVNWQRKMDAYYRAQLDARWDKGIENFDSLDNADMAVGVLGYGVMGRATAELLHYAGYRTLAWARAPKMPDEERQAAGSASPTGVTRLFYGTPQLRDFVGRCNVLVCLLPLTAHTTGIINAELLSWLPHGAAVINVARGGHVVEADLLAALDAGQVRHALLDVVSQEPLPSSSPLWSHPNVRITPHVSCNTQLQNAVDQIRDNYQRFLHGQPLRNKVDRQAGY